MRKTLSLLALSAAIPVMAQEPPAPKFAVVIPDYILSQSARGKLVTAELESVGKTLNERLRVKGEELQKMAQQLKSPGISDEGRARIQRDIQDGEIALKRAQEDAQKEFNAAREKVNRAYQQEVRPIVEALAVEWKLNLLFNYQEGLFQYADEAWITAFSKEVIKRYDAKYPTPGGPAPAPKPAKAPSKPAKK